MPRTPRRRGKRPAPSSASKTRTRHAGRSYPPRSARHSSTNTLPPSSPRSRQRSRKLSRTWQASRCTLSGTMCRIAWRLFLTRSSSSRRAPASEPSRRCKQGAQRLSSGSSRRRCTTLFRRSACRWTSRTVDRFRQRSRSWRPTRSSTSFPRRSGWRQCGRRLARCSAARSGSGSVWRRRWRLARAAATPSAPVRTSRPTSTPPRTRSERHHRCIYCFPATRDASTQVFARVMPRPGAAFQNWYAGFETGAPLGCRLSRV
mmetsp:Transcript_60839/g.144829  ORF Transcript_60839/g.144829 Transcript_60839/m.144829 type:complete len:260 (-) Transcript_60839:26-805(-)